MGMHEKSTKGRLLKIARRRCTVEERKWRKLLNLYEQTESAYQHLSDELMPMKQLVREFTPSESDEVVALLRSLSETRYRFLVAVVRASTYQQVQFET